MKDLCMGKIAIITDKGSRYYGRIGFNYSISFNAKKNDCRYSFYLLPDGKELKLKDGYVVPKRFMSFKALDELCAYLMTENQLKFG